MDADELFALVVCLFGALRFVIWLGNSVYRPRPFGGNRARKWLAVAPLVSLAALVPVLCLWADPPVRGDLGYDTLFLLGGALWQLLALRALPLIGLDVESDVLARDNPAALIAVSGVLLASGIVYAAANIGTGPTIWTTFGPAALGTAALFAAQLGYELLARSSEAIALEGEQGAGIRFAGVAVGAALCLARAVAGDWTNPIPDLLRAVPFLIALVLAAALMHRFRPGVRASLCAAFVYLVASLGWMLRK